MNTTTTIAIATPNAVTKSVTPKPTKTEIIEAMAHRKHGQLMKERAEKIAFAERLHAEAIAGVRAYLSEKVATLDFKISLGSLGRKDWSDPASELVLKNVSVDADLDNLPASLAKKIRSAHQAKAAVHIVPDVVDIKRDIRDAMQNRTQGDRVQAMLNDPATTKALDAMIKQLEAPAAAA